MSDETTLSAAALGIALVALVTAFGQLLQQYLATADGFRRCQKSVMGEYARKTHRRWRWSEFRFETLYTVPEITMVGDGAPSRAGQVVLTGTELTREKSLVPMGIMIGGDSMIISKNTGSWNLRRVKLEDGHGQSQTWLVKAPKQNIEDRGEMACWVPFLHWIHESTRVALKDHNPQFESVNFPPPDTRAPAIVFRERSWDFQLPDVVRPLAKSTLSDIAVIARRMGMKWKEFRPSDGILRAEGHSHIITSTIVRSLGIVLQYSYTGQDSRLKLAERRVRGIVTGSLISEQQEIYIPTARADRLGCGVIRTHPRLGLPDLTVSTQGEIVTALLYLDKTGTSSAALSKILKENPDFCFRVADLVAFTSPFIRLVGSKLVQVPAPSENVHGVTTSPVGRKAFRECLEEYVAARNDKIPQITEVLNICHKLSAQYAAWDQTDETALQDEQWVITRDPVYLDKLQDTWRSLTDQILDSKLENRQIYRHLLASHIRVVMFCEGGETSMLRNWGADYKADMKGYFAALPKIVEEMKELGVVDEEWVIHAWLTMMLRGLCWGASHFFVRGERVPIQYFGSQLPVYIG
ncbi:Uncharacterized protein BP5553_00043 [Venustampulla echinocandica]|uniref:Modin n=1 Tax=Venustampulla echinocandica TaxID=2656787 RepID=A0A370TX00_9HELO|nr:Uncharacterized protein BP5553_00043 [Venustampulla echinocandica]RDL40064.1 Uncharacterized protein BP5553_00043 [Venustampulla echinocandica]